MSVSPDSFPAHDWTPQLVSDVDLMFPARALELMPPMDQIPEVDPKWRAFQARWFFHGLPDDCEIDLMPGIDGNEAMRHLKVIQASQAVCHRHKAAAVAYLASLWFVDVRHTRPTGL